MKLYDSTMVIGCHTSYMLIFAGEQLKSSTSNSSIQSLGDARKQQASSKWQEI
jgi:hypothetical protein